LTKSGTSLLARSAPGASQAYAELMAPLKPREQAQLLALLGRLCDDLEPHARAPMHKLRA
ncbi:MAG: MarR family transcriptional regulator, partial [Ottowia sp.]|nr:MarR family transcriptional regulator [Ottowia sp.]